MDFDKLRTLTGETPEEMERISKGILALAKDVQELEPLGDAGANATGTNMVILPEPDAANEPKRGINTLESLQRVTLVPGLDSLREIIFQALGEASMCWSERPTGVFDGQRAKEIGDALIEAILNIQYFPRFNPDIPIPSLTDIESPRPLLLKVEGISKSAISATLNRLYDYYDGRMRLALSFIDGKTSPRDVASHARSAILREAMRDTITEVAENLGITLKAREEE